MNKISKLIGMVYSDIQYLDNVSRTEECMNDKNMQQIMIEILNRISVMSLSIVATLEHEDKQ